jgi:hypothetical protein
VRTSPDVSPIRSSVHADPSASVTTPKILEA